MIYKKIERILLQDNEAINTRNRDGSTPLHIVRTVGAAKLLVKHGANVHAQTPDGWTPLHMAQTIRIAQLLLSLGANVHATNQSGMTPLFTQVQRGHWVNLLEYKPVLRIIKFLVKHGAKMNIKISEQEKDIVSLAERIGHSRNDGLSLGDIKIIQQLVKNELTDTVSVNVLQHLDVRIKEQRQNSSFGRRSCSRVFQSFTRLRQALR